MLNFFRSTVYIRIKPEHISLLHVETGIEICDVPELAIEQKNGKNLTVAVGRDAIVKSGLGNITIVNGFNHPRTLIADFTVAEQTLKYFLKKLLPVSIFSPSPILVIHPQAVLEGGLTQIEIRAFAELGFGAGARKVYVWEGPELSKQELLALQFTRQGGTLHHA